MFGRYMDLRKLIIRLPGMKGATSLLWAQLGEYAQINMTAF